MAGLPMDILSYMRRLSPPSVRSRSMCVSVKVYVCTYMRVLHTIHTIRVGWYMEKLKTT